MNNLHWLRKLVNGLALLMLAGLLNCEGQNLLEKHDSPNSDYTLLVVLDHSKLNDEHLGLRLLNKNEKELDYLRTTSNNFMKWAVTWSDDTTIILDSHDVGTYGWTVDKTGRLKEMQHIPSNMEDKCIEAFKKKYGTHRVKH